MKATPDQIAAGLADHGAFVVAGTVQILHPSGRLLVATPHGDRWTLTEHTTEGRPIRTVTGLTDADDLAWHIETDVHGTLMVR